MHRHIPGIYSVGEWNLMGFRSVRHPSNTIFKQQVASIRYHDFFSFPETHCLCNETVNFDDYTIFLNNRIPNNNNNVKKGSGGIAIAIHKSVLCCHTILSVIKGIDGQIAIKLQSKITDMTVGILGLYLSPDSYRYGQEAENFFDEAGVIWQDLSDCHLIVGGGDVNARTRELPDFIPEIDGKLIPVRSNPDKVKNAHAESFLTFLKDNRAIILNGRVTPELNNYTFVCNRGCSVPDYIFCSADNLLNCPLSKTTLML